MTGGGRSGAEALALALAWPYARRLQRGREKLHLELGDASES